MPDMTLAQPGDEAALHRLLQSAFPEEDLTALVSALLPRGDVLTVVAREGAVPIAMVQASIGGAGALIGPLAVAPAHQKQGLGRALIGAAMDRLAGRGVRQVFLLGDPAYYGRLGFAPERAVRPPYALPAAWRDAWQSRLLPGCAPLPEGVLEVPAPWRDPALWR